MITERLIPGLRILFIGFNPSPTSYARGFNYAGKNNRFYKVLHQSGLTDRQFAPEESPGLVDAYGYGFTNIVSRPTRRADELTRQEYQDGAIVLRDKLAHYRPSVACYVGKGVYAEFTHRHRGVPWGFQSDAQVPGVLDFVAPATSGLVRMKLAEQVSIFHDLAVFLRGTTSAS